MDILSTKVDKLIEKIGNQTAEANRTPSTYGTDVSIFTSEIHLVVHIHDNPGYNTSQLANLMGVTKSVVSRLASKLEGKDLIYRYKSLNNKREIFYSLTAKGQTAYAGHNAHHRRYFHDKWTGFTNMPVRDQKIVIEFLERYTAYMSATSAARKKGLTAPNHQKED